MDKFYYTNEVPEFYKCSGCGASDVKLWRQYNTCADSIELLCVTCACDNQKEVDHVDERGKQHGEHGPHDSIGWLVPAIPCKGEPTYWGYTSVPELGVQWWRRLSTRVNQG